jgi:hypothetical protein
MTKASVRFDAFDIVVVPFPYADRLAEKRRPALVISNRKLAVVVRCGDRQSRTCRSNRAIRRAHREDRLRGSSGVPDDWTR